MVGVTEYMRCTACNRVGTANRLMSRMGCVCGNSEFINCDATWYEKIKCWLLRR